MAPDSRIWLLEQARKAANVEGEGSAPKRIGRGMTTSAYIATERACLECVVVVAGWEERSRTGGWRFWNVLPSCWRGEKYQKLAYPTSGGLLLSRQGHCHLESRYRTQKDTRTRLPVQTRAGSCVLQASCALRAGGDGRCRTLDSGFVPVWRCATVHGRLGLLEYHYSGTVAKRSQPLSFDLTARNSIQVSLSHLRCFFFSASFRFGLQKRMGFTIQPS